MTRTFSVNTTADPPSLLARIRKMADETGATLVGDEGSGRFSHGTFKGEYRITGKTVIVTITDKPWMIPWPVVESRVREFVR